MSSIRVNDLLANLPADELMTSLTAFMTPVFAHLPEQRLRQVSLLGASLQCTPPAGSVILVSSCLGGELINSDLPGTRLSRQ